MILEVPSNPNHSMIIWFYVRWYGKILRPAGGSCPAVSAPCFLPAPSLLARSWHIRMAKWESLDTASTAQQWLNIFHYVARLVTKPSITASRKVYFIPVQLYCKLLSDFGTMKENEFETVIVLLVFQTLSICNFVLFVILIWSNSFFHIHLSAITFVRTSALNFCTVIWK